MTTPNFRLPPTKCIPCAQARQNAIAVSQKILTEKMSKAIAKFMNVPAPEVERSEEPAPQNPGRDV